MNRIQSLLLATAIALFATTVSAQEAEVTVITTIPTLKAIVEEIGGERVDVVALARGDQDPHFVTATPVLMRRARQADLFIEAGFSLERWADEVANGSGNSRIFRGTPGRVIAGTGIPTLEIPSVLSREMGDIHPQGNPHVWLDPLLAKVLARNISQALSRADPGGTSDYERRLEEFNGRIDTALFGEALVGLIGAEKLSRLVWSGELDDFLRTNRFRGATLWESAGGWLKQAESLRGAKAYEFHKVWVYFARVFGLELAGTIEEQPGIPPGPRHLTEVVERIRREGIPVILVDNFYDPELANNVALETDARVVVLPSQTEGEPGISTYFDLMDYLVSTLTAAIEEASN